MKIIIRLLVPLLLTSCSKYCLQTRPPTTLTANELSISNINFWASNDSLINYSMSEKHSPSCDFVLQFDFKPFLFTNIGKYNAILKSKTLNKIGTIKRVSPDEEIFWLKDYFLFNGLKYNHGYSNKGQIILANDRKIISDYSTYQKQNINVKGDYVFVGHNDKKIYYETNFPRQQINNELITSSHALVEIDYDKINFTENMKAENIFLYKNKYMSIQLIDNVLYFKNRNGKSYQLPKYKESFDAINNSYMIDDTLFFCFNKSIIYKYNQDRLTKLIDIKSFDKNLKINAFRIFNGKLFYIEEKKYDDSIEKSENGLPIKKIGYSKQYFVVKVLDMKENKITIPQIICKN